MQHQYWVTKKAVLRKFGGKEDECIISSDAELDAKLELFRSISDCCIHLQRVIDLYQERLCYLAQEENGLGRYLKECGKNEKNSSAGQIMSTVGKALAYTGHQRLTIRSPLVRLHHEVETFRARAVTDTRVTVTEMEKARTEYRAALSWMKSVSSQLDPDTGHGLEKFRKAQSYVRSTKVRFDRLMLACLQKVDLLAAARCNMFSHALVPYQSAIETFSNKASEALLMASGKLNNVKPFEFCVVPELASSGNDDKDQKTFFNAEYSDKPMENSDSTPPKNTNVTADNKTSDEVVNLLGEDFSLELPEPVSTMENNTPSSELLDLQWPMTNAGFLNSNFLPSNFIVEGNINFKEEELLPENSTNEMDTPEDAGGSVPDGPSKKTNAQMSWLSLFAELDPLANQDTGKNDGDRA